MSAPPPVHVTMPRRALLALAAVAAMAALAAPGWAGPTSRVVLVIAAAVVGAAGAAALLRAVPLAATSRFQPSTNARDRREVPPELETLMRAVRESNDPAGRQVVSATVLLHLRRTATARLAGMRLDVADPADHHAIQRHVSLAMWGVLAAGPGTGRAQHLPSLELPATTLPALLDELERL